MLAFYKIKIELQVFSIEDLQRVDRRGLRGDLLQLRRVAAFDRIGGRVLREAVVARVGGERRLEGADALIGVRGYRPMCLLTSLTVG